MATITFDTHKFVRRLQEAGFEENQAEAISEAFKEASGEANLATKHDIERLEARFEKLETKLSGEMTCSNGCRVSCSGVSSGW
jgi:ubiquinone biosynthesis protein UbiJ